MITSKEQLLKFIRMKLGEPLIRVELTDSHILSNIDESVNYFTKITIQDSKPLRLKDCLKLSDDLFIVTKASEVEKIIDYTGKEILNFNFDKYKRRLEFYQAVNVDSTILYAFQDYEADEIDFIYNEKWVQEYAIALTKFQWGNILGKFSGELVGGATIDYDSIRSQGEQEIEKLKEELYEKWSNPAPFIID